LKIGENPLEIEQEAVKNISTRISNLSKLKCFEKIAISVLNLINMR
jgi:hypothetical protein